jgi:hypothetical protein
MPQGYGVLTNPKKALYNKVYNKTSVSVDRLIKSPHGSVNQTTNMPFWSSTILIVLFLLIFPPLGIGLLLYKIVKSKTQ